MINLDFADVRTTMRDAGHALLGIGMGTGDNRAVRAAESAVSSPLLETSVDGARSILLSITGGPRPDACSRSPRRRRSSRRPRTPTPTSSSAPTSTTTIDDEVWVTVIATRFDGRGRRADGAATGERRAIGTAATREPPAGRAPRRHREELRVAPARLRARRPEYVPGNARAQRHVSSRGVVAARPSADRRGGRAGPARGRQRGRRRGRRGADLVRRPRAR